MQIDNLYYCPACKKKVWRRAATKSYKSYCDTAGKDVRLIRAKTVKIHLVIDKWVVDWLRDRAISLGIGLNECINQVMRERMELEKRQSTAH